MVPPFCIISHLPEFGALSCITLNNLLIFNFRISVNLLTHFIYYSKGVVELQSFPSKILFKTVQAQPRICASSRNEDRNILTWR